MIKLKLKVQNRFISPYSLTTNQTTMSSSCNTQVVISFSCFNNNKEKWLLNGMLVLNNYSNSMCVKISLQEESSKR